MRNRIRLHLLALSMLFLAHCDQSHSEGALEKPNILFIAIDDLRPALGCYGDNQVISPNIDKVASEGMIFQRAYCNVPVCGASRASMLTGILPTRSRFVTFKTWAEKDAPHAVTLPQVFKEAGYTTISNGKIFHHKKDMEDRSWSFPAWGPGLGHAASFDPETTKKLSARERGRIYEFPDVEDDVYPDGLVAKKTIEDIRRLKEEGKPFFLACGFIRPHMPFYAPKKYWDLYHRDSITLAKNRYRPKNAPAALKGSNEFNSYHLGKYEPKTDRWHRMMRHGYYASTSYIDKLLGDVMNAVEMHGLSDNTIVVIWGDHGWHLGEHDFWGKHNTLHNALQVPLIIKVPRRTSGAKTQALVEDIDIFPTLCELANLPVPTTVQGRSFTSLLDIPQAAFRDVIYSRYVAADAVVTSSYSYSLYENGEEMLYDRAKDPQENTNVVDDPAYGPILAAMKNHLKVKMTEAASFTVD